MKKILIRSGMAPWENFSALEIIRNNRIGGNSGNLVYACSLYRFLMTDDSVCVVPDRYRAETGKYTQQEIEIINQEYSMYVIPLADAVREGFVPNFRALTAFINQLKIPVILAGMGISAGLGYDPAKPRAYDGDVRDFLKAVLDHSAVLGVRGEHTLGYVKRLGFTPEQDVTVIGCPSLYTFGPDLPCREPALRKDSKVIVTNNPYSLAAVHRFLRTVLEQYPGSMFLPQRVEELRALYYGEPMNYGVKGKPDYPCLPEDPLFREGRAVFFLSYQRWADYVRDADLCVGPRLHGGILCTLEGVPALTLVKDIRTLEVAEYHHLPTVRQDAADEQTDLGELLEKADRKSLYRDHRNRFRHYCRFLERNGAAHIYQDIQTAAEAVPEKISGESLSEAGEQTLKEAPLDRKMKAVDFRPPVLPCSSLPALHQRMRRLGNPEHLVDLIPGKLRNKIRQIRNI